MRLGEEVRAPIEVIPTGSISLDVALGIGGCRAAGSWKSTVLSQAARPPWLCTRSPTLKLKGGSAHSSMPSMRWIRSTQDVLASIPIRLVSQPDNGEQALEIADMLIRSGALALIVIDSVAALTPRAEIEGRWATTMSAFRHGS